MANHAYYNNIQSLTPNLVILTARYKFLSSNTGDQHRFNSPDHGDKKLSVGNGFTLDRAKAPSIDFGITRYSAIGFDVTDPSTISHGYMMFEDNWQHSQLIGLEIKLQPASNSDPTTYSCQQALVPMMTHFGRDSSSDLPYIKYSLFRMTDGGPVSDTNITDGRLDNSVLSVTAFMRNSTQEF